MKVIAHRGANHYAPQNTLPAFQKALELGADGFENDVHLTKDGEIVICHDYTIDQTSNGTGSISDYTYKELLQFDFGSFFSPEFAGEKIPTLSQFFDLCRDISIINVEIKPPQQKNSPIVARTIQLAKEFGLFDQLLISSFDSDVLVRAKELDARTKTGLLYSVNIQESPHLAELLEDHVGFAKHIRADALHPFVMLADDEYVENCHNAGIQVNPWTINLEEGIQTCLEWGCDGLITDVPDIALEVIRKNA